MNFWGNTDTSITFCEDKYTHLFWVSEFYNTISSLLYIFVGILFFNKKTIKLSLSCISVGIGSIALHMTSRKYGQLLDESAMLIGSFYILSEFINIYQMFIIPIIISYFYLNEYFIYFFIIFGLSQIYIAFLLFKKLYKSDYFIYYIKYVFFFLVATICWFLDQTLCSYVQLFQLHAFWHIFTSLSLYYGFICINYVKY